MACRLEASLLRSAAVTRSPFLLLLCALLLPVPSWAQEEGDKAASIKAYRRFLELEPEHAKGREVQSIIERLETE